MMMIIIMIMKMKMKMIMTAIMDDEVLSRDQKLSSENIPY